MEVTNMSQTGINFINQKGKRVLAYSDTVIFYIGKGNSKIDSQDKIDSIRTFSPFGIIKTNKEDQPFKIEFDASTLILYVNPGMLSVYGRQVYLKDKIKLHDFHQGIESDENYCTLYIEVNLNDILNQTARFVLTTSSNGYEYNPGQYMGNYKDNLYKHNNGVYRVPIAQFKYKPMDSNPFIDLQYIAKEYDFEARESTVNLKDNSRITGRNILGDLTKKVYRSYGGDDLIFLIKSDNKNALEAYNNESSHNSRTPGYSWSKETKSIGGITIGSNLSNLMTIKRVKILNISSSFGTGSMTPTRVYCPIDWNHLKGIKLFFDSNETKAKVTFWIKSVVSLGIYVKSTIDAKMNLMSNDLYCVIENNKAKIALYGNYYANGKGYLESVELNLQNNPQEYTGERANGWDECLRMQWGQPFGESTTQHPFMFITIEGNYFTFKTFGEAKEHNDGDTTSHYWYIYKDLEITNASGALYADFIYQGDVDI